MDISTLQRHEIECDASLYHELLKTNFENTISEEYYKNISCALDQGQIVIDVCFTTDSETLRATVK